MSSEVEALVKEGRIERVEADRAAAIDKLEEARRHLDSASVILESDPQGAYALLYDAARKAIDAHMLAAGYRVSKSRPGTHQATARYATSVLDSGPHGKHPSTSIACGGIAIARNTACGRSAARRWRPTSTTHAASSAP